MKSISTLVGGCLFLIASTGFATSMTAMDKDWTCSTNASSSSVEADKMADKQMSETKQSAADSYAMAAKNCRDCTKITCEMDD